METARLKPRISSQKTERLAILFADISGSGGLYDILGDTRARESVARCLALMTDTLVAHRGTLIKTIGDEIMCVFPDAADAFGAACDMQCAVVNSKPGGDTPMYVRIGFHYGEALRTANDVFGDAVNVAARITEVARARHVIASKAAVDALPSKLRGKATYIRRTSIKGKQEQLDIFQIQWNEVDPETTRVGDPSYRRPRRGNAKLALHYRGKSFYVDGRNKGAMLGRADSCEIVVKDQFASRQHARVELHFGKFVLSDQSINGTYIRFGDNQPLYVVRENVLLHGSGSLSLGRDFSEEAAQIIDFVLFPKGSSDY